MELTKLHKSNKPFFSFVFTSSNHDPFEIPEGVISPIEYTKEQLQRYDSKELLRHKAIQYADYALGKFIAKAKTQPYWEDTVFLVVADHDARATGSDLVPINNFHIPGVILNSGNSPQSDERIVSQIDLAPTLLSLMGVENHSPMLGQDLTEPNSSGRAMMQYAENFAYMIDDEVTILQPSKPALNFEYNINENQLNPKAENVYLSEVALAHVLWGSLAYKNGWYFSLYD
ncbi:sulfatase-like hydrolase/transferase [Psychrosphaera sp. G1-22]|uniref:Sulfatase-like hydrolase/transferase n=1 Tax=Psychrosphaera algicola TaxID=3023714 RepID=A0ABT5FFG2_9GAMM|nr:sulfatase-like hydrolase/transferase [Psychrosphaera sp. G1-22]MDC2890277.1 sulfatase-like hydrolase/transferase [Psychrosphaera sp. G1-22]